MADKAKERFTLKKDAIKEVFTPQCCTCTKNINYHDCTEFAPKPLKYTSNTESCPKKIKTT